MKPQSPSTHKKVWVETFEGEPVRGYVSPRRFDRPEGLEMMDAAGQVRTLPWKGVKTAWFVRDWDVPPAPRDPRVFARRPRLEGLWVRVRFRDDEVMEGIVVNDLLHLSPHGYLLTPPDLNGNHQRAFVPRAALAAIEVLGVNPSRGQPRRRRPRAAPEAGRQPRLFSE
ncbi:MAG: hypothetical protein ACE5IP_06420 [Terriglobia bacterium]